jgi:hypothetical protein
MKTILICKPSFFPHENQLLALFFNLYQNKLNKTRKITKRKQIKSLNNSDKIVSGDKIGNIEKD